MLKSIIFSREDQAIYACDENENVIKSWECRDEFEYGYNDEGEERESLPNGEYILPDEAAVLNPDYGDAYGTFYIVTGDRRGRDIHGGGTGLPDPYAPRQGWLCTLGCLRMQNEDGEELCRLIMEAQEEEVRVQLVVTE